MASLGLAYLAAGKPSESEQLLRECLTIYETTSPDSWRTFSTRSLLGGSLLAQKKYAEAEPLLLSGFEGMKQREAKIPAGGKVRLKEPLQALSDLYDALGRSEQAAEWKQKLQDLKRTETNKPPVAPPAAKP